MPPETGARVEVRRLTHWFNDKFFEEVSGALVMERIYKRYIPAAQGGGPPDTDTLRAARVKFATIWPISAGWCAPATGSPAKA